ncbi:hypothetical protein PASE110613_09455 [Paenibacillus sediminis]|uniref:Uncharacterized protein n=1 Tax=Paenibacillus sediminis TaxID=664909 RepID=A0ABS4H5A6_9BACL|nr:hypothetical protein [Paenibacillus sediminis]MBP1937712.1 hypothetical protein [Paenibacillus sediminis]
MASVLITNDELSLIKSYLIYIFIQRVFERDSKIMEQSGVFKTPELYIEVVQTAIDRVSLLLREAKKQFQQHHIRVYSIKQSDAGITAHYECRGYHGQMNILWSTFRAEMMKRMRAYLGYRPRETVEEPLLINDSPVSFYIHTSPSEHS